jgi:HSP20 family protein
MATLARWEPFRDFTQLTDAMNRLLADERPGRWPWRDTQDLSSWTPAVDIYEDAEHLRLTAELAGIDPKDVDIRLENGTLTLMGERKLQKEEKQENYHRIETRYGSFSRSFTLPTYVDVEKVKAEFKNGLLNVYLPKREESKPKQIKVKIES